jgi:CelD/BcsL family acetyltransferase involved in cellulose biosynthesis
MRNCPEALWESLVRADPSSTFFQTPAWFRIGARWSGRSAETVCLGFDFPGGPACLPLLRDRRWGRHRHFSPFGTYSGLVSPRALAPDETAQVEAALRALNIQLVSSPFARNIARVGRALPTSTQVVTLAGLDPENPMKDWDPDPRRKVRMAREQGVTVRAGSGTADWDAYDAVYRKSLRRWGARATSSYPRGLFADIAALPETSMRLWLAEHEGAVAAGYIAFYHNDHACIWHGASDPEKFRSGAVQMLYHDMLAHAARAGYGVFDFLGSGGTASLEAFKRSLGARTLAYDSFLNRVGLVGALARARESVRATLRAS